MKIRKAAGALGAYLSEVRAAQLDDAAFQALRQAVVDHQVVFLRDQDLTPAQFAQFAARFGPVMGHGAYGSVAGAPHVQILESTAEKPSKIEVWHSDMTFHPTPPSFTLLYSDVVPEIGGDTLWASATFAFEKLSPAVQGLLRQLTAVHDFRHGFQESLAEPGGAERLAETVAANPPVEHPVVRMHPESAKEALYVNALFTTRIRELRPLESARLLEFLYRHVVTEEHTVRLNWQPRTIAIWDNRSTQHKPVNDFFPQHRRMYRVTIQGDRPSR